MTPTFWRAADYELEIERSAKGNPILRGVLLRFNEWNEINSPLEGHFMESFTPSVFKKTISENIAKIRAIFQHGRDPQIGDKPLGRIRDMPNDGVAQRYEVELFRASYVDDLLPALEAGQFGSSFSARNITSVTRNKVEASDYNPEALPEVVRKELAMREFGPVTYPAISSATAEIGHMRSLTDDHLQPAWAELLTTMGWQPSTVRAATLEPDEEPEPEAEPAEAEPEETTPPDDEPEHSADEVDKREEETPSWQLRR